MVGVGFKDGIQVQDFHAEIMQIIQLFRDAGQCAAVEIIDTVVHALGIRLDHQILVPLLVFPVITLVHGLCGCLAEAVRENLINRGAVHERRRMK